MKIGILTFHRAENFGAVLQAYALMAYLRRCGHDAEIIDYRCPSIEAMYHILDPSILWSRKNVFISLKMYLSRFRNLPDRYAKKRRFRQFRNEYLHQSAKVHGIGSDLGYDAYITGSDQVWNMHLTGGFNPVYFLDFPKKEGALCLSYAASSEKDPLGLMNRNKHHILDCLSRFNALSVRESFLKSTLASLDDTLSGRISVCCGPTFLLRREDYLQLAVRPDTDKGYVLVYHMTRMYEGVRLAEKIAREKGLEVIEIFGGYIASRSTDRIKQNLGPLEILGYMADADTVITTSFHGIALSLILQKNFWVMDKGDNLRQKNVLDAMHLGDRLLTGVDDYRETAIDYDEVMPAMDSFTSSSRQYLKDILK